MAIDPIALTVEQAIAAFDEDRITEFFTEVQIYSDKPGQARTLWRKFSVEGMDELRHMVAEEDPVLCAAIDRWETRHRRR